MAEDFYSVDDAARILQLTPGRVRQLLRSGELEGVSPEESGERGWKIPMHVVHDSYEAWRERGHDDLVLALALACWRAEQPRYSLRVVARPAGL